MHIRRFCNTHVVVFLVYIFFFFSFFFFFDTFSVIRWPVENFFFRLFFVCFSFVFHLLLSSFFPCRAEQSRAAPLPPSSLFFFFFFFFNSGVGFGIHIISPVLIAALFFFFFLIFVNVLAFSVGIPRVSERVETYWAFSFFFFGAI